MRYVIVGELRDGLPVEFLGEEPDAVGVISEALTSRAVALYPGHPGRVWRTQPQHVQVSWAGLEEEPASYAYGFYADSLLPSGRVIGLGHLAEADFAQRETVMAEVLADEGDLTGWLPPWRGLKGDSRAKPATTPWLLLRAYWSSCACRRMSGERLFGLARAEGPF